MTRPGRPGRPARKDDPERLVVRIPARLKRWLRVHAIDQCRDMGQVTTEALELYRRLMKGAKP